MLNYQGRLKGGSRIVSFLSKSASLSSATLLDTPPAGTYRVSIYAETTTAGSGNVTFSVEFTTDSGAKTAVIPATLTLTGGTTSTGSSLLRSIGSITLSTTYASTGVYSVWAVVERLE